MVDLANFNLVFRRSTTSAGSSWNSPVVAYSKADFPSVAVSSSGTIVIGFNQTDGVFVYGYQTMVSVNGGQTWSGPYTVTTSGFQAFGRVVWSPRSSAFHVLFVDKTSNPTYYLKRAQSTNGTSWTIISQPIDTYTAPAHVSPTPIVNGDYLFYGFDLDASAASGLGWVAVHGAARTDNPSITNVKYCAESLGCTTISYPNDLFMQGITTSSAGDLWLNILTYGSTTSRTVPLKQIATYRTSGGSYLTAFVNPAAGISPSSWELLPQGNSRCTNPCYAMGDYNHPTMNIYTAASLPFVNTSSRISDLSQVFVQDPTSGLPSVPDLVVGPPVPFGQDSTYQGLLPPNFIADRQPNFAASVQAFSYAGQ